MTNITSQPYLNTPNINILDNRGLPVRAISYNRTKAEEKAGQLITRHRYNAIGQLGSSIDPRLFELQLSDKSVQPNLRQQANLAGVVLSSHSADAGHTLVFYDIEGRPVCQQTANKARQRFEYEDQGIGHLLSRHEQVMAEGECITDQYIYAEINDSNKARNRCGQLIIHYDTAGVVRIHSNSLTGATLLQERQLLTPAHHPASRITVEQSSGLTAESLITRCAVGSLGQPLTQTDARNNQQRFQYNCAGQLTASWLQLNGQPEQQVLKTVSYSAAGQVLREESGNGVVTEYTYEPQTQRLTGIKTTRPAHSQGPKMLQDLRYHYDPVGNILSIRNDAEATRFFDQTKSVPENTYTYDALYQLIRATGNESVHNQPEHAAFLPQPDTTQTVPYTRHYSYDHGGNLTQIQHIGASRYTREMTVSERNNHGLLKSPDRDWDHQHIAKHFDAAGNQLILDSGTVLTWNGQNQLTQADITENTREYYLYGSDGMRVVKQSVENKDKTHQVIYLPGIELHSKSHHGKETEVWQVINCGAAGRAQVRALHWEQGKPTEISNNQLRYSFDNQIGSSLLELDETAQILSQEEYFPYGGTALFAARSKIEASYKTIRYSGKERDATGLYYYGYRYYIPWAGRWLSTDPTGFVDGLNLFRMVRNNPINCIDRQGLFTVSDILEEDDLGISEDILQLAFNIESEWEQLINYLKNVYPDMPNEEFDELTLDAKNIYSDLESANSVENIESDTIESDTLDVIEQSIAPLSFHKEIRNSLKKEEGDFIFRGDLRSPDEIFKTGFSPKGTTDDLVEYVYSNIDSIYVGFSKEEKIARIYAAQKNSEGYLYVIKKQKEHIDVNAKLRESGQWAGRGRRFYEYAKEIAVPNGAKREDIIKAYPINSKKKYTGEAIHNPLYK
ncbi:RHS repeat-associated core domain-containing protein [Yersinia alsatica]|uniref:RHS repeat-associated core domain-containing protein n=1 Tax=Yersinia alsatica TaxID=2890317 RepID=UPI0011A2A0F2|nr:RHS repeat-associated core domain-containing protein [Yersinia alsatica]